MRSLLAIVLIVGSFSSLAWACDPNEDCTRSFLGKSFNDPICDARKLVCRTQCGDINADANKYILNAQTEIRRSEELIEVYRKDMDLRADEMNREEAERDRLQGVQLNISTMLEQVDKMLESQATILEFIKLTKSDEAASMETVAGVNALIEKNSSNLEVVEYLQMYLLVLEQQESFQSLFFDLDSTQPLVYMKKTLNLMRTELAKSEALTEERWHTAGSARMSALKDSVAEIQKIDAQRAVIQQQEARKCSPIL